MTDTPEFSKLKSEFEAAMREDGYTLDFLVLEGRYRYSYMETELAFRGYEAGRASRAESQSGYYLWEHPKHPSRVARPEDADFAKGEPLWVRCYPVEVFGGVSREVSEPEGWRSALQFYAEKSHFTISEESAWDTVSGEPANFWCDEEGTATVEDGAVAAMALAGTPMPNEEE